MSNFAVDISNFRSTMGCADYNESFETDDLFMSYLPVEVDGNMTIRNNVYIHGGLFVTGDIFVSGDLVVTGDINCNGNIIVNGNITSAGSLFCDHCIEVSELTVVGNLFAGRSVKSKSVSADEIDVKYLSSMGPVMSRDCITSELIHCNNSVIAGTTISIGPESDIAGVIISNLKR